MSERGSKAAPGALDGMRILDLSRVLAGPSCAMILGDLGAEVIKVENPGAGDDTRAWGTMVAPGQSTYYLSANRNKKSIALDLSKPEAQAIVREIARQSDVLIENFKLGGLGRFGLDYASLAAINPQLIYCSISGYGRDSPAAPRPGYDFVAQAESGLMAINGEESGPPLKIGFAVVDIMTGMYATQAVLAAIIARKTTGRGQFIDMALYDCAIASLSYWATGTMASGKNPRRYGNAHPDVVPYEQFECSDGGLVITVGNDAQFRKFCQAVIGRPDLSADPRYRTNPDRVRHRAELSAEITKVLRSRPRSHWLALLLKVGVPGGPVRTIPEALAAEETTARRMVRRVAHPTAGTVGILASPLRLSETPVREPGTPPLVGQHTDEVLTGLLGFDAARLKALRAAGAIA